MKKKTVANLIMVAIILVIMAAGVLGAGYIQGWFDRNDGSQAVLTDVTGVVKLQREGVAYPVEKDTLLRAGDRLTCQSGATVVIRLNGGYLTLGEKAQVTVTASEANGFAAVVSAGEIFANCQAAAALSFDGRAISIENAAALVSVRSGAQSVSIFSGTVAEATAGQIVNYVGQEVSVSALQISSLNTFTMVQLRVANQTTQLCFTNAQLDQLEADRKQAMQDILNSQIPTLPDEPAPTEPAHIHSYVENTVAPTCTQQGHTSHTCACGDSYTDSITEPTGHTWGDWITTQAPSEQQEGAQSRTCIHCDTCQSRTLDKLTGSHVHSYTKKTVAATCTADGYTLYTCTCGHTYVDSPVKAQGHTYTEKVVAPTCTASGYTEHTCACGSTYKDSITQATGHRWTEWTVTKEPTATEKGAKKRDCASCGASEQASVEPVSGPAVAGYVYLTIRCDTILENMERLEPGKVEFVPADGEILPMVSVYFYEGETVFDVLKRACDSLNIQLEYSWTPMYDSYYVEGIHNLYEFDCGFESGWMYKVNGWFPNYGCSSYSLKDGDVIVWAYTCKGLGSDLGAPKMDD